MTALAAQRVLDTGLVPVFTAATSVIDLDLDDTVLYVKNGSGASINATIETPGTVDGDLAVADRVVAIGAGAEKILGPFGHAAYKNPTTSKAKITLSSVTTVTVAALTF